MSVALSEHWTISNQHCSELRTQCHKYDLMARSMEIDRANRMRDSVKEWEWKRVTRIKLNARQNHCKICNTLYNLSYTNSIWWLFACRHLHWIRKNVERWSEQRLPATGSEKANQSVRWKAKRKQKSTTNKRNGRMNGSRSGVSKTLRMCFGCDIWGWIVSAYF